MISEKFKASLVSAPLATRLLKTLLSVVLFAFFAHLLLQFLNLNVYHQQHGQIYELSNRFDLDDEASVATWISQALFLLLSILAAVCAYVQINKPARRFWGLIAITGLVLSIDEIAALHEYILQTIHVIFFQDASPSGFANAWLLVLPFIFALGSWIIWTAFRYVPKFTVLLFAVSGITFLLGAVGVDLVASIVEREGFLNQGLYVATEETLELIGVVLFIYASAHYLETNHSRAIGNVTRHLQARKNNVKNTDKD